MNLNTDGGLQQLAEALRPEMDQTARTLLDEALARLMRGRQQGADPEALQTLWRCYACGSTDVEVMQWTDPNTGALKPPSDWTTAETWCHECHDHTGVDEAGPEGFLRDRWLVINDLPQIEDARGRALRTLAAGRGIGSRHGVQGLDSSDWEQ